MLGSLREKTRNKKKEKVQIYFGISLMKKLMNPYVRQSYLAVFFSSSSSDHFDKEVKII